MTVGLSKPATNHIRITNLIESAILVSIAVTSR